MTENTVVNLQSSCGTLTIDHRSLAASGHCLGPTVLDLAASHPYLWQLKITLNLCLTSSYSGLTLKLPCQILPLLIFSYSPYPWKNGIEQEGEQYTVHKSSALQSCPEKPCDYEAEFKIFTYWRTNFYLKQSIKAQAFIKGWNGYFQLIFLRQVKFLAITSNSFSLFRWCFTC